MSRTLLERALDQAREAGDHLQLGHPARAHGNVREVCLLLQQLLEVERSRPACSEGHR